jgi:hypothetical protein
MDFNAFLEREPDITGKICFSDEAHYNLDGYVNKHNARFEALENPHALADNSLHAQRSLCGVHSLYVAFLGQCFLTQPSQAASTSVSVGTILCLSCMVMAPIWSQTTGFNRMVRSPTLQLLPYNFYTGFLTAGYCLTANRMCMADDWRGLQCRRI